MDPLTSVGIGVLAKYVAAGLGAIAGRMITAWRARSAKQIPPAPSIQDTARAQMEALEILGMTDELQSRTIEMTDNHIMQRVEFQERKRVANLSAIMEHAAAELDGKEVEDHEPDPDFATRFFECAQDISNVDMQLLWAKLLAGEVQRPGQFSLRTLDTLRNLSVGEAKLFAEVCNYVAAERMIIYSEDMHVMGNNLHLGNILKLAESGLVMWTPDLTYTAEWLRSTDRDMPFHKGHLSFRTQPGAISMTRLPIVRLTTVGRELFGLTEPEEAIDTLYVNLLAKFLEPHRIELSYVVDENVTDIGP